MTQAPPSLEHFDVLIVGAGLSGVAAAYHLQKHVPHKSYAILEGRSSLGGTWDLFRYPGVRSDSDMYTLGFPFRPWPHKNALGDGASILRYVRDTAREYGIDRKIRFNRRVTAAAWSTAEAAWTVEVSGPDGVAEQVRCNYLYMCSGYYDYAAGYTPEFPGRERFRGSIVHPQDWTSDVDYTGKRCVVIGSGATAVTLVPALAETAAHVTMLQRSPSYVIARPDQDPLASWFRRRLPPRAAYAAIRWRNVLLGMLLFQLCKRRPTAMKRWMVGKVREALGPDYDVDRHFKPRYNPWDQRLCVVPNGDLFQAIHRGRASVVTDHIESFEEDGIRLRSGEKLEADLIITATGLNLLPLGGVQFSVDGAAVDLSRALIYKGMALSDVPNLAYAGGYTNASWTLKCVLTAEYVCRLLAHMERTGQRQCTPRNHDRSLEPMPSFEFSSGYVLRAAHKLPKQGSRAPWRVHQNYVADLLTLRHGKIDDGVMVFSNPQRPVDSAATISSLPPRRRDHSDYEQPPAP